jgi:predicted O-linked N-acetylglucosamine transferase (SPINDLY family)
VAASALTAAGLPELITQSLPEYERRALELAKAPRELEALRTRLAQNRTRAALFDTKRFCQKLEAAYHDMQDRALSGDLR